MNKEISIRRRLLRRIGATRLLTLSFLLFIVTGATMLWLPFTDRVGPQLSYLDSLFIATSATCVTGLVPTALFDQYNIIGHTIILIMIQVGGLGVMSLIAFLMTVMKYRLFQSEKKLIQDALNKSDMDNVPKFLKSIVKYTFFFEGIGVILFMFKFVPVYGWGQGIFNSVFLAVSAFCNAGMDNISMTSMAPYATDPLINFTICGLIATGGLGFTVWFDLRKRLPEWFKKRQPLEKLFKLLSVHTKIVLIMTSGLIVSGVVLFMILEYNNTLSVFDFGGKLIVSLMQSVTLRTAGFSSVDYAMLRNSTQMFMILFMLIGGSPGGTAGGIKTTSLVMIFLMIKAQIANNANMTLFKRTIPTSTFHKAFMVTIVYVAALIIAVFLLTLTDETIPFLALVYEAVSAIATVGLSISVTPHLSDLGKIIIILLMFIGRVGPITIVLSMVKTKAFHKPDEVVYSQTDILIG